MASLPGGPVSYFEVGEGPELVLLHGGGLDSAKLSWGHLIPTLGRQFRVLAPDWPGYGGSAWSEQRCTTQDLMGCLEELLDYWSLPAASFAGISMGAGVALGLALSKPHRVNKLVLLGSYGLQPRAPLHKLSYLVIRIPGMIALSWSILRRSRGLTRLALRAIMRNHNAVTDELVDQCYASVREPTAGIAFHAWQRSEIQWRGLRTHYSDRLPDLHRAALVLHGANDPLVPVADVERAAALIPGGALRVFKETGHWPQRERPEECVDELVGFIESGSRTMD